MDKLLGKNTFIVLCPACKRISFDPKVCFNCGVEIPSSSRIKMINQRNRVFEVTGIDKVSKYTFPALYEASSSKDKVPKCDTRYEHNENCACVQYLKTEEEVKSSERTEENEVTEAADESNRRTTEEHNSNSVSASSMTYPDPSLPDCGFVSIYEKDMACLADGKELNDNIIDFYLNYVYHEIVPEEFKSVTHIFSACFNEFLVTVFEKSASINRLDLKKNVQKWVKNVDIFSKDFIFVPINRSGHWYLAVICFMTQLDKNSDESSSESPEDNVPEDSASGEDNVPADSASGEDNVPEDSASGEDNVPEDSASGARKVEHPYFKKGKPCICFFDSLNKRSGSAKERAVVAGTLKKFLSMLWEIKHPSKPYDWDNFPYIKAVCPQQNNSVDCGLYLLQYVESFFKDPIPYFENPMPALRNWFPKSCIANKRKAIKEVIPEERIKKPKTSHSFSSDVIPVSP